MWKREMEKVKKGEMWLYWKELERKKEKLSAHVIFLVHQVVEKALKAGMYAKKGLRNDELHSHKLIPLAEVLGDELNDESLLEQAKHFDRCKYMSSPAIRIAVVIVLHQTTMSSGTFRMLLMGAQRFLKQCRKPSYKSLRVKKNKKHNNL